jgi:hypothetical protein
MVWLEKALRDVKDLAGAALRLTERSEGQN